MTAKYVATGARRYVVGDLEPFDQKNEMFCRPLWDEKMLDLGKKFYMTEVPPKNKAGYRLKDRAMVNAAWHLENTFLRPFRSEIRYLCQTNCPGTINLPSPLPSKWIMTP